MFLLRWENFTSTSFLGFRERCQYLAQTHTKTHILKWHFFPIRTMSCIRQGQLRHKVFLWLIVMQCMDIVSVANHLNQYDYKSSNYVLCFQCHHWSKNNTGLYTALNVECIDVIPGLSVSVRVCMYSVGHLMHFLTLWALHMVCVIFRTV